MLAWMPSKCILKCFRDSMKAPGLSALPLILSGAEEERLAVTARCSVLYSCISGSCECLSHALITMIAFCVCILHTVHCSCSCSRGANE